MSKSRSSSVCCYILAKIFEDARWKVILLSLTLLVFDGVFRANRFCESVSVGITPWLFPHMLSAMPVQFTFIIGYLLIISSIPYLDSDAVLVLTRSGHREWGHGVIKSISIISLIYVSFMVILSIVFVIPSLSWEAGWGKVLITFARTPEANENYLRIFSISDRIVTCYTPVAAMVLSILLEYLCLFILALVVLLVNVTTNGNIGVCVGLSVAALDFFVYNDIGDKAAIISPVSLARLSIIDPTRTSYYPSPFYAVGFMSITCIVLIVIAEYAFKKMERH